MFRSPWICRSRRNKLSNLPRRQLTRFASTANHGSFPPSLLTRARTMKSEHDRLSQETQDTFNPKIAKRIGELRRVATALEEWETAENSISELHSLLEDPSTDTELRELAREDLNTTKSQIEELLRNLKLSLTPKDPFADLPCLLELRPGAGGDEAALFASDLLRMYQAYCTRKRFSVSLLKYETALGESNGSDPPLAEAILEIETPGAYGEMRSESGVHRVQRVPATETKGRVHTSAVSVVVLPSPPTNDSEGQELEDADLNDPNSDYYINVSDVRIETMKSRGAGGQHVNTTDSAVRLTHIHSGTVVNMQDSRSQHQNRKKAWQVLRSRIAQAKREAREQERMQLRRSAGAMNMGRENKIRTYNWGQQRVTDHRSGLTIHALDDVMKAGDSLEKIVESVKSWLAEQEIQAHILEDAVLAKSKK